MNNLPNLALNVGLADLSAWITNLGAEKYHAWSAKKLGAYHRQRKFEVWQMIALMEGLKAVFANPVSPITVLRSLGLKVCNSTIPLKRLLIEQAVGLPQ